MISKTIFRLIDGLTLCANKLCGVDTIHIEGEETDLLTYLFSSNTIWFVFIVSVLLATILLVVFTIFMIIRSIAKEKAEGTPAQIAIKAFKTLLMFFLVPVSVIVFMGLGNTFLQALFTATMQDSATPGSFLFCSLVGMDPATGMKEEFIELFKTGERDYYNIQHVYEFMNLSDFPFIMSYLVGGVVLFGVGSTMLIFVERVFSLVILYIAAPFSLASSMLDDGARFKLWRDQFLVKFITGYGMIVAINIDTLVCGLVMDSSMAFFPGDDMEARFLNLVMKLLVIAGGALTMQKSMALVGNLVSSGAGSNELRDNVSAGALASMAGGAAKFVGGKALFAAATLSGARVLGSVYGDAKSMASREMASSILRLNKSGKGDKGGDKESGSSGAKNNEKAEYGSDNKAKDAINNQEGFKTSWDSPNSNHNDNKKKDGGGMVNKAIEGGGNDKKEQKQQQPKEDKKE